MTNEFMAVSDGTYTLQETENKNQFYFYRNDGEVLTDIDREPMDLYQAFVMQRMMSGEITDMVMSNIYSEISDDEKCIRLTISDISSGSIQDKDSAVREKKPNFLMRLFHKICG